MPAPNRDRVQRLEFAKTFLVEALRMIRRCSEGDDYPLDACLRDIATLIQQRLDFYAVTIFLLNEPSGDLVLLACAARDPQLAERVGTVHLRPGQGLCGQAVRTGQTMYAPDVEADPHFIRGGFTETRSELCIPVTVHGRVLAVLNLQDSKPAAFDAELIHVFEELSGSIGLILEIQRRHDDLLSYSENLQRRAEEMLQNLRASEQRFRRLVEHLHDPVLLVDTRGAITYANRAAAALFVLPASELAGRMVANLCRKGSIHKLAPLYRAVLEQRQPPPTHLEVVTQEGQTRTVEATAIPLVEGGRVDAFELILRDVTEKLTIERLRKNYYRTLEEVVRRRTQEIRETQRASILALAMLAESIDEETGNHLDRIRHYCRAIALALRKNPKYRELITDEYVELLFDLSPLHDLGKVGIRDHILLKKGELTSEEFQIMQKHTEIGGRALREAGRLIHRESMFAVAEMIARFHHERWDGTGYPAVEIDGEVRPLHGEEIPLCARIVALADVYDALSSKRPYKDPLPHQYVRERILTESGKQFDPDVVQAFLDCEQEILEIRRRYPDTDAPTDRPLRLPDRDREEIARLGVPIDPGNGTGTPSATQPEGPPPA